MKSFFYGAGDLGDTWESVHPGVKAREASDKLPSVVRLYVFDHEPKKVLKLAKKIKTPHTLIRAGEILWSSSVLRDTGQLPPAQGWRLASIGPCGPRALSDC